VTATGVPAPPAAAPAGSGVPVHLRVGRWLQHHTLTVVALLILIYLLVPIFIIALFSFNDTKSRFNFVWNGFTLRHWENPFAISGLNDALLTSLALAAVSTVIATALGTLMAIALVRYQFRVRKATNFFVFLPLSTPEVVLGASLLSLFLVLGFQTGFTTLVIAHVMFNISFVVVVVRARLIGFDESLEEAAQDLYANPIRTFFYVTLPLIAPGVFAAALLSFAISFDDFVITNFNAGDEVTFPLFIYGAARVGIPPQVNVLATMIVLVVLVIMIGTVIFERVMERRSR
jgi:spermidine/putrescine transport system permease protein